MLLAKLRLFILSSIEMMHLFWHREIFHEKCNRSAAVRLAFRVFIFDKDRFFWSCNGRKGSERLACGLLPDTRDDHQYTDIPRSRQWLTMRSVAEDTKRHRKRIWAKLVFRMKRTIISNYQFQPFRPFDQLNKQYPTCREAYIDWVNWRSAG